MTLSIQSLHQCLFLMQLIHTPHCRKHITYEACTHIYCTTKSNITEDCNVQYLCPEDAKGKQTMLTTMNQECNEHTIRFPHFFYILTIFCHSLGRMLIQHVTWTGDIYSDYISTVTTQIFSFCCLQTHNFLFLQQAVVTVIKDWFSQPYNPMYLV